MKRVPFPVALGVPLLAVIACGPLALTLSTASPTAQESAAPATPTAAQSSGSLATPGGTSFPLLSPTPGNMGRPTVQVPTVWPMTAWPTLPPQPAAPTSLPAGNHIQLDEVHMVSRTEGWGILGRYLLVTEDGGRTWREVTPPASGQGEPIYGAFLNWQDAWLSWGGQVNTETLTVYYTPDGGQTWTYNQGPPISTGVQGDVTWPEFAVLDARHVWVLVHGVYGAGTQFSSRLFGTSDGGLTWTPLGGLSGADYTGMVFADVGTGLRTTQTVGGSAPAIPGYEITSDGGASWDARQLPPPSEAPGLFNQYPTCGSYQPALPSPQSIRLLVGCFDESNPPSQFVSYFYASNDAGSTWTAVRLPSTVLASQDRMAYFAPGDALLLGRDIYQSSSDGQAWEHVSTVSWDGQFSFVDPQHGWAVARANGHVALVETSDGGATWAEVGPKVAN